MTAADDTKDRCPVLERCETAVRKPPTALDASTAASSAAASITCCLPTRIATRSCLPAARAKASVAMGRSASTICRCKATFEVKTTTIGRAPTAFPAPAQGSRASCPPRFRVDECRTPRLQAGRDVIGIGPLRRPGRRVQPPGAQGLRKRAVRGETHLRRRGHHRVRVAISDASRKSKARPETPPGRPI